MSYADAWSKWFDVIEGGASALSAKMIELVDLDHAKNVLDIGTGVGEPAITAALRLPQPARVTAVDSDPKMIAAARKRANRFGVENIDFEVANAETMPLSNRSCDAILARWSLMFVLDKPRMLRRLYSALRPGGRLVTGVWCNADSVPALSLVQRTIYEHFGWPLENRIPQKAFSLADKERTLKLFTDAGFIGMTVTPCEVVYEFGSPADYIQYRKDVSDVGWSQMADKTDEDWDAVYEAIERKLESCSTAEGRCRIVSHAYCIMGQTDHH